MKSEDIEFSIIIPFGKHAELLGRAVDSIIYQTYKNWELIIVNDGTGVELKYDDPRIRVIEQPHMNRVYAQNAGMAAATGDWICLLDSDDSYINTYLEQCHQFIKENPEYDVISFGSIVYSAKGTRSEQKFNTSHLRAPFEHDDHAEFKAGGIAQGNFIFSKRAYSEVGGLPTSTSPYGFADECKKKYPKLLDLYGPLYMEGGKELGNPWGNDFMLYYMLTRKFKVKVISTYLYIQYAHL